MRRNSRTNKAAENHAGFAARSGMILQDSLAAFQSRFPEGAEIRYNIKIGRLEPVQDGGGQYLDFATLAPRKNGKT